MLYGIFLLPLLFQASQSEKIGLEFHHMTEDIEAALSKLPIDKLGISDEVREQVQLLPDLHELSL